MRQRLARAGRRGDRLRLRRRGATAWLIVYQRLILHEVVAEGLLGRVFGMQAASDGAAFAAAFVFTGAITVGGQPAAPVRRGRCRLSRGGAGGVPLDEVASVRASAAAGRAEDEDGSEQLVEPLALSSPDLGR